MSVDVSAAARRRAVQARKRQEKRWAAMASEVTVRRLTPEELERLKARQELKGRPA